MNKTSVLVIAILLLSIVNVNATNDKKCGECVGKNSYSNSFCSHFKNIQSCTSGTAKQFCKWKPMSCDDDDDNEDDDNNDPCENLQCQYGCSNGQCNPPPGTDPCLSLIREFGCSAGQCNPDPTPDHEPAQEPISTDKPKKSSRGDSGIYLGNSQGRCSKLMTLQLRQGAVYKGYYFDSYKKHHLVNVVLTGVTPFPIIEIGDQDIFLMNTWQYFDYEGDGRLDAQIRLIKQYGGGAIVEIKKFC
jgi:hypothetical protein